MARSQSHVLTDHNEIRRWAEERNAAPACVRSTGGKNDIGVLRLDFPGYSGAQSLEPINWNEWFNKFDERGLALLVQDNTARGARSNFNKLVARETAQRGSRDTLSGSRRTARKSAARKARPSSAGASRRKTARKSTSAKKKSGRSATRKSATSRSRGTSVKRSSRSTSARTASRSTGRKSASRSNSRSSQSRTAAQNRASAGSSSNRSPRNTIVSSSRKSSGSPPRGPSQTARSRRAATRVLVDHDEIRRWAEDRNAEPACVRGTGGGKDPGMIRLDFPGYSGADSLERIEWENWFRAFDENNLALVVQGTLARGEQSNFNKLVARENAMAGSKRGSKSGGSRVRASETNKGTKKAARGSNRARRTESARGRNTTEQRRAA